MNRHKKIKATTPYLYIVGWQFEDCDRDAYYVGMRHAVGCHPDEFWKSYFTSSERVKRFRAEHGEPNFIMILETFETCHDRDTKDRIALKCSEQETAYLKAFSVCDDALYLNVSYGDGKFGIPDEITRAKMSASHKGERNHLWGKTRSLEIRSKISKAQAGERNHLWGRKHSAETRQKLSEARKGENHHFWKKTLNDEHRAKLSAVRIGKTHSEETRAKLSRQRMGKNNYFWGKTHSDETRARMSEARKGTKHPSFDPTVRVFRHPDHGERICTRHALRVEFDLNQGCLSTLVRGNRKSVKGWTYHGTLEVFQARNGPAPE